MSEKVQYDDVAASNYATVRRNGGISRAQLTIAQSGDITYDDEASSDHATVKGADGKNHRAALVVNLGGVLAYETMPVASKSNEGDIVQYVGETTSDYHKGYFYESYQDGTAPSVATIEQTVGEGLEDLAVNKTTFETQITESGTYNFVARLNREHIIATLEETSVRMDRDEDHDVEGAIAWTPDGETYFYTEELVPDVGDDVFADPDGETVAGAVTEYNTEAIGWEFDGEFVDISDYGITYTPADPTATVSYSSEALGTVTVDADTFATQVAESDKYIFDAVVTPERILATVSEDMIQYNRDADDDDADLFAWKDEHNVVVFTDSATPSANDDVYSDTAKTPLGTVDGYSASSTKWYRGSDEITLATYGIAITGTAEDGNTIHIQYVSEPPHQDDVITVSYAEAYPTYDWRRINVQPGGSGGGDVNSVNNIDPDEDGNVELSAENINASVGGTVDSVQDHLDSLRNDLGDLADDVDGKQGKITGTKGNVLYIDPNGNVGDVALDSELVDLHDQETESLSGLAETQAEVNEEFVDAFMEVLKFTETVTGNTPTIANVQGNHIYNCTGTLTSLTLTAVETTYAEATIYMTTGASITVNVPASVKIIGYTEFSPNTSYVISIANNVMVVGEINA